MTLEEFINERFGGQLKAGGHFPDGAACILEAVSAWRGMEWTDNPARLGTWDFRPINDMAVSPEIRAEWMPRVYAAYADCRAWLVERQNRVAAKLASGVVREFVAELPGLPETIRKKCRTSTSLAGAAVAAGEAAKAANWAGWEIGYFTHAVAAQAAVEAAQAAVAARSAAQAAAAAAQVVRHAAAAAAAESRAQFFIRACQLWISVAEENQ